MREQIAKFSHADIVWAEQQTKGRGMGGNSWHSCPSQNLTFSVFLCPKNIEAKEQFWVLQFVSVSILQVLKRYDIDAKIKWPNDIYVENKKLCGILMENAVVGDFLENSIVGIGLNVNETEFPSFLPNPTSLKLLLGKSINRETLILELQNEFSTMEVVSKKDVCQQYLSMLYQKDEFRHYSCVLTKDVFEAKIVGVSLFGELILEKKDGQQCLFSFKEIEYL